VCGTCDCAQGDFDEEIDEDEFIDEDEEVEL